MLLDNSISRDREHAGIVLQRLRGLMSLIAYSTSGWVCRDRRKAIKSNTCVGSLSWNCPWHWSFIYYRDKQYQRLAPQETAPLDLYITKLLFLQLLSAQSSGNCKWVSFCCSVLSRSTQWTNNVIWIRCLKNAGSSWMHSNTHLLICLIQKHSSDMLWIVTNAIAQTLFYAWAHVKQLYPQGCMTASIV